MKLGLFLRVTKYSIRGSFFFITGILPQLIDEEGTIELVYHNFTAPHELMAIESDSHLWVATNVSKKKTVGHNLSPDGNIRFY